jgi:hypothetical protein
VSGASIDGLLRRGLRQKGESEPVELLGLLERRQVRRLEHDVLGNGNALGE